MHDFARKYPMRVTNRLLEEVAVSGIVIRGPDSLKMAWDTPSCSE
ncbi:hypothetical protein [Haliea sp. E17]